MSDESAAGGGPDAEVPEAVREWLGSVAAERGVSEAELLRALAGDGHEPRGADERELERLGEEFGAMIEDLRERVIQVKREADGKAPVDHTHPDLNGTLEQVGRELRALEAEVDALDDRVAAGFENYEEVLTYLTDTTDRLDRRLGQLAGAVVDLRERAGEAARDEARRTALAHLTETANRHGVGTARCEACGDGVDISLLVEPRCPHCDTQFSALEPKSGFFRTSVLHTGTMPALESGRGAVEDDPLADLVASVGGDAPVRQGSASQEPPTQPPSARAGGEPERAGAGGEESGPEFGDVGMEAERPAAGDVTEAAGGGVAADADDPAGAREAVRERYAPTEAGTPTAGDGGAATEAGGGEEGAPGDEAAVDASDDAGDLQAVDGIGSAYAARLREAGITDLLGLAVADPEDLGEAIDVPPATVEGWIDQADGLTGSP